MIAFSSFSFKMTFENLLLFSLPINFAKQWIRFWETYINHSIYLYIIQVGIFSFHWNNDFWSIINLTIYKTHMNHQSKHMYNVGLGTYLPFVLPSIGVKEKKKREQMCSKISMPGWEKTTYYIQTQWRISSRV